MTWSCNCLIYALYLPCVCLVSYLYYLFCKCPVSVFSSPPQRITSLSVLWHNRYVFSLSHRQGEWPTLYCFTEIIAAPSLSSYFSKPNQRTEVCFSSIHCPLVAIVEAPAHRAIFIHLISFTIQRNFVSIINLYNLTQLCLQVQERILSNTRLMASTFQHAPITGPAAQLIHLSIYRIIQGYIYN